MIGHSITVTASKGGVGKTSLAAGIGTLAARAGWRVLLVDLDPQGNLGRELGYVERGDGGRSLFTAMVTEGSVEPLVGVRERLDVVAGGRHTRKLITWLGGERRDDPSVVWRLDEVLAPMAESYDLVVVDTPPGELSIHEAAAAATHYLLVPTQGDAASNDGIAEVLARIGASRTGTPALNPALELLGVAVMLVPASARSVDRRIRADLAGLLGANARVFEPSVRFAKQAAIDLRERGWSVGEYEERAAAARPWYEAKRAGAAAERFSSAASGLAEDYQRLTDAVLAAFGERQRATGFAA